MFTSINVLVLSSSKSGDFAQLVYNFLKNHLHTADEFIIETKNIFYACSSCQREFLILQEYVAKMGKKMKITIYGDEAIQNTGQLLDKVKNK